ncbi:LOW QUALITY PROTEIN: aldehyde dehydrogenase family 16 member A1 [Harpia harpyja]|uniref:LOW QUALITY PROTEIN: aldehyde dehydrogenase family 16 member A1 n=1 Tax=Harpia harpyja TaxID=202280 RepID=UPI0022B0E8AA|nr:LOW QUALITY PROTEIN: aldehyde dehydrogenase family 16 member A1 [Harpia harpyja]
MGPGGGSGGRWAGRCGGGREGPLQVVPQPRGDAGAWALPPARGGGPRHSGPPRRGLETHGRALGHFVAGTWLKPPGRGTLECREAATGRLLATVPRGEEADLAAAVEAAAVAAAKWGALGGPQRAQHLQRLAAALEQGAAGLGAVAALSGGRPLAQALGADLELGLWLLRVPAGWAQIGPPGLGSWAPLGVVAVLMSGPCSLAALLWKLGSLLAMGNAALVLPPAEAPLAPLLLAELSGAGGVLPPGLLNVVTGTPCLRRALRAHTRIAAITFLGDRQEEVQDVAWGSPCRGPRLGGAQGGRVVVIVLDSADLDSAAAAIVGSMGTPPALFPWGGCVVLVQEGVVAPLERRLRARLGGLRVGDPLDLGTDVGPLPPTAAPPKGVVQAAHEEGAEVFQPPVTLPPGGRFYPPTLITGVAPTSRCLRELVPGPVLVLLPVRSPGEAVTVASGLPHVAAGAVWAQDVTLALDTADRLPLGLVWLNALNLLDPRGGCAGGDGDGTSLEALREYGHPPWEPPLGLGTPPETLLDPELRWSRLPASARARVLRGAAAALGGSGAAGPPQKGDDDDGDSDGRLWGALLRWAARVELLGGVVQEVPGGRALLMRRPLGVVGVAWSGPRPPARALELLPPALALGNGLVVVAPPSGVGPALRLQQALVAAGLPGGALAVLPGGAGGDGATLARHHPDGLWLCGGGTVPLLLLLAVPPPGICCSFDFNPVSSTFSTHVDALTPWLILDYPVAMPSNLEMDSRCSDLWGLHFGAVALGRMAGVAGGSLAPRLQAVAAHIAFVAECHIHDPQGCVRLEVVNVSQLLGALVQHLGGLQGRPPHFPGCAHLRCRPGPLLTTPAVQHERTPGSRLGPPHPSGIHGLVLLGGLGGALGLAAAAWVLWRRPCAQRDLPEPRRDWGAPAPPQPPPRAHKIDVETLTLSLVWGGGACSTPSPP